MTPLWQQRNFMLLWSGQLVSWIGTEVSGIALPLVVLALTGSPAQAGNVAAIRGLAYVFWALPAGVAIDRMDRKLVMVLANLGSGLAMASIALGLYLHNLSVVQLYITGAVEGSFFVFANLGRFASLPKVVSQEQFPAAAAQSGAAGQLGLLIGPPLGGLLYQTVGGFLTFFVDSLSYLVNAASIFLINIPLGTETATARKAIHQEIMEAFLWFWHQPVLRFITVVTAGRTVLASGLYLLIIVLANAHQASSVLIGLIFAGGAGGGILGATLAAKIHSRFTLKQLLLGISLLSFIIVTLYTLAINTLFLAAITALFYVIDPLYYVTTASYAAKLIPDEMRGRVTSLTRLVVLGAYSFGFFVTGNLLQYGGSSWTIGVFASLLFALLCAIAVNRNL